MWVQRREDDRVTESWKKYQIIKKRIKKEEEEEEEEEELKIQERVTTAGKTQHHVLWRVLLLHPHHSTNLNSTQTHARTDAQTM